MNVIYMNSHDTGRYIQPYGHAIPTPKLQAFAEEGVTFRQCFCANPTCSPSRAALLTGQYAHSCGLFGLAHRGFVLQHPDHLLAHTLKAAGYETVLAGFQHVLKGEGADQAAGYELVCNDDENYKDLPAHERAARFIKQPHDKPFFLDVAFGVTHRAGRGFAAQPEGEEKTDPRYVKVAEPFPDTPETRQDMAEYIDSARTLDYCMGYVIDALEEAGLADDTLFIITTDHGIPFPAMKCNLTDHGLGVMLMIRGPKGFEGGKVIDSLVSHIDLFPTICDVTGIDHPDWLEGKSILPLLNGERTIRDAVYGEVNYHASWEPKRAVRTERYKYIKRFNDWMVPTLANCDESMSKDFFVKHGWDEQIQDREMLFDTYFDPSERNNLVEDEAYQDILKDLRDKCETWMKETNDPLLENKIIMPPEGAKVNVASSSAPGEDIVEGASYMKDYEF